MIEVIGVRFRTAGKVYYFAPAGYDVKHGNYVIVETARGVEMGKVVMSSKMVEDDEVVQPLKSILRVATPEDIEQSAANRAKEKSAFQVCKEKIRNHKLEMKLIDAEYTFDGTKLLFYFTADGRIDFRELVKDLASVFRTRIELRQIGVRDETKILGGIGICGRVLCCHSYLSDFAPVSIKMAKEQNLSLNPTKISGTCGRLMCCLKNEEDTYEELNRKLPAINDFVVASDGVKGQVQSTDVLRQRVKILVEKGDEKEIMEYPVEELSFRPRRSKKDKNKDAQNNEEISEELKALEKEDMPERNSERGPEKKERHKGSKERRDGNHHGHKGGKNHQQRPKEGKNAPKGQ